MAVEVHEEIRDGIAVLTLDRPVANALSPTMRADLAAALDRTIADDTVLGIVLCGAGAGFSSGVDIAEYDAPLAAPWVDALCRMIEAAPKPVVAALHGSALGGGFELALAAHGRVAQKGTGVALPEVTLGLIPGGGATQRLPRYIGAQAALEIMLSGRAADVADPRFRRLFDIVTEEPPLEPALKLARALATAGSWGGADKQDRGLSDPDGYQKAVAAVAGRLEGRGGAEADLVKCVEAAQLLPFGRGLEFERVLFEDRAGSAESRAVRHIYTAERRTAIMPELAEGRAGEITNVALVGAAAVLAEIAVACLDGGQRVQVLSPTEAQAGRIIERVQSVYAGAVERGRLDPGERDARLARLSRAGGPEAVGTADLVVDAADMDFDGRLPAVGPGAVWAVLHDPALAALRQAADGPAGQSVALRFYRPAHSVKLAELAVPPDVGADAVATMVGYLTRGGGLVLRTVERPGMLGHSLMGALMRAGLALVRAGASPYDVDAAAEDLGFARGPFKMIEADGLGRVQARLATLMQARGLAHEPLTGLLGARAAALAETADGGRGFYAVTGRDLVPDPNVLGWLRSWRAGQGGGALSLPPVTLDLALNAAVVNEAARLIDEQAVLRASDIDVAMVRGYGFARNLGGPLMQADLTGLLTLLRAMQDLAGLDAALWSPQPLIEDMVKNGRRFF